MMNPLYILLKFNDFNRISKKSAAGNRQIHQYNAKNHISWNGNFQNIVDGMIDYLRSLKVIAFPNFEIPFFVNCDASGEGLGAVLPKSRWGKSSY